MAIWGLLFAALVGTSPLPPPYPSPFPSHYPSPSCLVEAVDLSENSNVTTGLRLQPSTLNPQPSTLNPQPSTLNHQPSTLNPQVVTLRFRPKYFAGGLCLVFLLLYPLGTLADCTFEPFRRDSSYAGCVVLGLERARVVVVLLGSFTLFFFARK